MLNRISSVFLVFLLPVFSCGIVLLGQETTATISGVIKDETGAVLPGVEVSAKNVDTGMSRTMISDDQGRYSLPELPPGNYEVQTMLAGFQTAVRSGINLTIGRHAVVDLTMKVGAPEEKLVVSGEAPLVETTSSSLAGLVGENQIRDLPLNGRNFVQLTLLETGVVEARASGSGAIAGGVGLKMSFHGARIDYNNFIMDGTSINNTNPSAIGGASGGAMGVETIREFQVITSNFSAEFGRAGGGVINVVTKSGTNELHGSLFYFHRNDNFDARNFFDPGDPPEFKRNQFGLVAGGPIKKNKTFVFGGYEGLREGLGLTLIGNVPTAAARQGILVTGGNVTVNPAVKPYLDLFPSPNSRDFGDGRAEFVRADTQTTGQDFYQFRVDHNFSESDSLFVRYTIDDSEKSVPRTIPTWIERSVTRNQYMTIEEKKILSARLLNVFRFGFNRSRQSFQEDALDSRVNDPSLWYIPNASIQGLGPLGIGGLGAVGRTGNEPQTRLDNAFQWTDTVSYTADGHSLKVGGEIQRIQTNEMSTQNGAGTFSFSNLRSFLLAQPTSFIGVTSNSDWVRGYRQTLYSLFLQDDYQVRPSLTLNLGVRWEFMTNPSEVNGKVANLLNPLVDANTVVGNPLLKVPKDNIAPRIGFAWDPFQNGKTSVRGGFGMYHQMIFRNHYIDSRLHPPFIINIFAQTGAGQPAIPFPHPLEGGRIVVSSEARPHQYDHNKMPYMMQYNLSVQRELVPSTVLTIGYVGSRGVNLVLSRALNTAIPEILPDGRKFYRAGLSRRNPAWGEMQFKALMGDSYYHALQVKLARRVARGLQFQTSYTLSHSIDDSSNQQAGEFDNVNPRQQDPYDLRTERGNSAFDSRHVLVINSSYDLPLGKNVSGAAAKLLAGWQISGIVSVGSGVPVNIETVGSLDRDRDVSTNTSRPNLVAGAGNNPVLGGPDRYFDAGAFRLQDPGFYGNLGRNTLVGPGVANMDLVLIKNTAVGEGKNIQFRAESFNLLNRANFYVPDRTVFRSADGIPSPSAGRITRTTGTARQLQFGLKFTF